MYNKKVFEFMYRTVDVDEFKKRDVMWLLNQSLEIVDFIFLAYKCEYIDGVRTVLKHSYTRA